MLRERTDNDRQILIDFLDSTTRYYVLLFRGEIATNITYHRKGFDEIAKTPQAIEKYLKAKGFVVDSKYSDSKRQVYFWCEQLKDYDEMIPEFAEALEMQSKSSGADSATEKVYKNTIDDFYSLFAVNIGDDFLFSYLIGTIVRLVNAEVGLIQIVNDGGVSNFSMGFNPSSAENIRYHNRKLSEYLVETRKILYVEDTSEDRAFNVVKEHTGHIKSFLAVPIFSKGDLIAIVYLANKSYSSGSQKFDKTDYDMISAVSMQVGSIITNALLYKRMTEMKEFNEEVLENIPTGIQTTALDNSILFRNKYMRDLLIKLQMDASSLVALILRDGQGEFFGKEYSIELDKETAVLSVSRRFLKIGNSQPIYLYTFSDITLQRDMEAQLRKTERLAAAGELIAGIAHEIKNPLTSMKGFADLVWAKIDDKDFIRKFATIITDEINRLNLLIERFLSFAKPEIGMMSEVRLEKIVEDSLSIISYNLTKNRIEVSLDLDEPLTVYGSREMLIQVFINILLNSIQALEGSNKPSRTIGISGKAHLDGIEIVIEDNGVGIDPNDLERVFNPFYTTKVSGSGLGLSISHRIMTEHKGSIRIESKKGLYTRMILGFPAVKELHRIKQ